MKVAIPCWQGRVSPVLDVAASVLLADLVDGMVHDRQVIHLAPGDAETRAKRMDELGVDLLVCGALSRPFEIALVRRGIEIVPQTCGDAEAVLAAIAAGRLSSEAFLMPGCCGRRRWRASRRGRGGAAVGCGFVDEQAPETEGSTSMPRGDGTGPNPGGRGQRAGRSRGGGRGCGRGRMGDGPSGDCVCSQCGHTEPHAPGQPCNERVCPKCGAPMTRS